ncbi:hypothetical protein DMUE_6412, partial [Dictyocoela muelleri]
IFSVNFLLILVRNDWKSSTLASTANKVNYRLQTYDNQRNQIHYLHIKNQTKCCLGLTEKRTISLHKTIRHDRNTENLHHLHIASTSFGYDKEDHGNCFD